MKKRALVWLRRDLRLHDHLPLVQAASLAEEVAVAFVFDTKILEKLHDTDDRRLTFIHQSLQEVDELLRAKGSKLVVLHGDAREEIPRLAKTLGTSWVVAGRDYEPAAKARDAAVAKTLASAGTEFVSVKDQVIFEGLEVQTKTASAFKVFTPYANAWKKRLSPADWEEQAPARKIPFAPAAALKAGLEDWTLKALGFKENSLWLEPGAKAGAKRLAKFSARIADYKKARDYPGAEGTSGLSVHLRFGTVSIRDCVRLALRHKGVGAETWLNELIWRDFYQMILDQFPHVVKGSFREQYAKIEWPGKEAHFKAWCEGRTGYPIVDASMRHFNETGWMHNRMRMVVASFLTKDLLVSWQKGEAYFARYLLDFDLAANNGGWQWSASTGCDAQPYFRIFNPYSQSEKFDADGAFIRRHVPELKHLRGKEIHQPPEGTRGYPAPIVDHSEQRKHALALFKKD